MKSNFYVNKDLMEWVTVGLFFFLSFFNTLMLIIFFLYLFFLNFKQREVGALKSLNFLTMREIINPGIAVGFEYLQPYKLLIIYLLSVYLLLSLHKLSTDERKLIKSIFPYFMTFIVYCIISSFAFSSLPMVALSKIFSYALPFTGICIGIIYTGRDFDWIKWITNFFSIIVLVSVPFIFSSIGYLRNGVSFQGIINHPNLFGIFLVLFIAVCLSDVQKKILFREGHLFRYLLIVLALILIIYTKSRTSLGSAIILLLIYIFLSKYLLQYKFLFLCLLSILFIISIPLLENVTEFLLEFFIKGSNDNILASRTIQLGTLVEAFKSNPYFGRGFAVPYLNYRSFVFSFDYVVEPGNLFMAVLAYSGIFGMILFLIFLAKLFLSNFKNFRIFIFLPVATILVCMGEMVFFSTNNIGIFIYMFLAIYVLGGSKNYVSI